MAMTSFASNITRVLDIVAHERPKKILDVGSGFGKYGLLIKELLLSIKAEELSDLYPEAEFTIDAVEELPYFYNQPAHDKIYDNVFKKNVFDLTIKELESYDLILLIDVVEHWDKELTKQWLAGINTNILISTPKKVYFYDKEYYGCRKHISQWEAGDLDGEDLSTDKSLIFLKRKK